LIDPFSAAPIQLANKFFVLSSSRQKILNIDAYTIMPNH